MPKRCVNCGSVWTLDVARCAFCGGPAVDQPAPPPVPLKRPLRRAPAPERSPGPIHRPEEHPAPRGIPGSDFFGAPPDVSILAGLATILICGLLPVVLLLSGHRGLALAACAFLLPLPFAAWLSGLRAETQGRFAALPPSGTGPVAKTLGVIALAVLLGESALLAAMVLLA